jgi:hypothetical protein
MKIRDYLGEAETAADKKNDKLEKKMAKGVDKLSGVTNAADSDPEREKLQNEQLHPLVVEHFGLDETSKAKALAYLGKAPRAAAQHVYDAQDADKWAGRMMKTGNYHGSDNELAKHKSEMGKSLKRLTGIDRALKIVAKEDQQVNPYVQAAIQELNAKTLTSYADKAHQQAQDATYDAAHLNRTGEEKLKADAKKLASKRAGGVQRAQTKLDRKYNAAGDAYRAYTGQTPMGEEVQVTEGKSTWHIYDTKTRETHSTYNNKNLAMKKYDELNDKHAGYDSPGGLVHAKYGVRQEPMHTEEVYYETLDLFLEALMSPEVRDRIKAHELAGHKTSDQASRMKNGEMEYSFVVTQPSGKRSRHIYHGNKTKHETMSPAPRSKEAHETGEDDEDK